MIRRFRGRSDVLVAWLLVVACTVGAYGVIVAPAERRVRAVEFHAHDLYELANRNERMSSNAVGLSAARVRVARDVAKLAGENSPAKTLFATLALLQSEGRSHHVVVSSLNPDGSDTTSPRAGSQDVTLVLRGTYQNALEAIADLSRHDVLFEVLDVAMARSPGEAGAADLDATLHATIYYRLDAVMKEKKHADSVAH